MWNFWCFRSLFATFSSFMYNINIFSDSSNHSGDVFSGYRWSRCRFGMEENVMWEIKMSCFFGQKDSACGVILMWGGTGGSNIVLMMQKHPLWHASSLLVSLFGDAAVAASPRLFFLCSFFAFFPCNRSFFSWLFKNAQNCPKNPLGGTPSISTFW